MQIRRFLPFGQSCISGCLLNNAFSAYFISFGLVTYFKIDRLSLELIRFFLLLQRYHVTYPNNSSRENHVCTSWILRIIVLLFAIAALCQGHGKRCSRVVLSRNIN